MATIHISGSQSVTHPVSAVRPNAEENWRDRDGHEFVDGQWVEKNMGARSSLVAVNLTVPLASFCREHKLGFVLDGDTGYQGLFPAESKRVRKPDRSFIRYGRLPDDQLPRGYVEIAPDLAVEVISPNDEYGEVQRKKLDYLAAGVRLIWIIDPPTRSMTVIRADRTIKELLEGDELDGEDVVPGFRMAVADAFVGV